MILGIWHIWQTLWNCTSEYLTLWDVNALEKSVIKANQSFLTLFFFKWKRCQSACLTFEHALFMFSPCLPSLYPHFLFLPLFCHIVFSFFPQLTQSCFLLFTYVLCSVNVCTKCLREISAHCSPITAFTFCTGQRGKPCGFSFVFPVRRDSGHKPVKQ